MGRTKFAGAFRPLLVAAAFLVAATSGALAAAQNPELAAHVGEGDDPAVKSAALAIGDLDIDVTVTGDTARTVVTAHFLNSSPGVLEGNFAFDLPPGSVVTGYGLDIDGKMVDGVLAGQRKATVTYETRVRRGFDPGLAEVTRAGAFTTRVFPILEGKGRTVRLTFVTPLDPKRPFTVPLVTEKPVGTVSIHIKTDAATAPALQGPDGVALKWSHGAGGYEASASAANLALKGALVVGPVPPQPLTLAKHQSGDTFFEIDDAIGAAVGGEPQTAHLRIYWDSSLSRRDADLSAEIDLVGRYVAATHPASVDVIFFSTERDHLRSFHAPSAETVTAVLKTTDYQGGTSLKPLFEAGLAPADACLLFSDGNVTVDSYRAEAVPCMLSTVSSAKDANRGLLAALARKSAGVYADLSMDGADGALARLLHPGPRVRAVKGADGQDLDYALLPSGGDRIRIVGRAPAKGGIVVELSGAATRRYDIDLAKATPDDSLGALWAARRVDELNATDRPDRNALLALSRRYSVETPVAAFVVFENIGDYVTAEVEPPASLGTDMLANYRKVKAAQDAEAKTAQKERLDEIVAKWTDVKAWWQTQFKAGPRKPIPVRPMAGQDRAADIQSSPVAVAAPPPPPPPPPAPSMYAPVTNGLVGRSSAETVVVTGAKASADNSQGPQIEIAIAPWNPDRPYIAALNKAKPDAYWSVYRDQEKQYGTLPAFYLDVGEFLFRHGRAADAIRVALNAMELPSANTATMMILADRLMRYGDTERALWLYDRILYLEPDLPQPRRNLALALVARAEATGAAAETRKQQQRDYGRALDLLNEIVTHPWQGDYDGIEVISLMEANRIVAKLNALGVSDTTLDPRLVGMLDVDLRVVLEWNTDGTDMDLWVDEPTGERAIYSNPRTAIGGRLSNDMRQGYGPEEYLLHRAPDGRYTVRVNVFASDRLNPNGATTVRAHVFRNYGRADEQEQTLDLEVSRSDATHVVGMIKVAGSRK